jgi:hypothetical protein
MLSKAAEAKLSAWVGPTTWHASHDYDMDRWYDFVDQYQRDHGYTIDEAALREHIEQQVEGGVNDHLRDIIRARISLAYNILDFLKRTKR